MSKVISIAVAVWQLVAKNPPLTAAVFNVLIIAGATIGLHLTTDELASVCGVVAVVFGLLVRAGVIPVAKVSNVKAGFKSTVPDTVEVAKKFRFVGESGPEVFKVGPDAPVVRPPFDSGKEAK